MNEIIARIELETDGTDVTFHREGETALQLVVLEGAIEKIADEYPLPTARDILMSIQDEFKEHLQKRQEQEGEAK